MKTVVCYLNEFGAYDFFFPVIERLAGIHTQVNFNLLLPEYIYISKTISSDNITMSLASNSDDIWDLLLSIYKNSASICGIFSSATSSRSEWIVSEFAQNKNIRIIHAIDSLYGYKTRFKFQNYPIFHECVLLIDDVAKSEAVQSGFKEDKLMVVGHPGWQAYVMRLKNGISNSIKRNSRSSLFLGAPVRRDYGLSLGFDEDDAWSLVNDAQKKRPDLIKDLIYCPHPQQNLSAHNFSVPVVPFTPDLFKSYGQIFGMFSSPMMIAHFLKKLSVSVQPGNRDIDVCPFSARGFIKKACNVDDFIDIILNADAQNKEKSADLIIKNSVDRALTAVSRVFDLR